MVHGVVLVSTVTPSSITMTSQAPFAAFSPVLPVAPSCSVTLWTTMVVSPPSLMIQSSPMVPSS